MFQSLKEFFEWNNLYVRPEVHEAMLCVVEESIRASKVLLFSSNFGKALTLKQFEIQQHQTTGAMLQYLKESWFQKIVQSIRMCLRDLGKGWFDLGQSRPDVYEFSKLKRFMELVQHRMQVRLVTFFMGFSSFIFSGYSGSIARTGTKVL